MYSTTVLTNVDVLPLIIALTVDTNRCASQMDCTRYKESLVRKIKMKENKAKRPVEKSIES